MYYHTHRQFGLRTMVAVMKVMRGTHKPLAYFNLDDWGSRDKAETAAKALIAELNSKKEES